MIELEPTLRALASGGADGHTVERWSLFASESQRLALGVKDRQIGNAHSPLRLSEWGGARYLIVWDDGLVSRGYLERRQVEHEPEAALAVARSAAYVDPDAAVVLGPATFPEVLMMDRRVALIAAGDTALLARRLGEARDALAGPLVRTWSGSFSAGRGEAQLRTSAGLEVAGCGTTWSWYVNVNGEAGEGFSARAHESDEEYAERLSRLLETARHLDFEATPIPGGAHPVILHPRVVTEYVLETLFENLAAATVAHGEGAFARESFGGAEPVLREDLTLRIDPLLALRSGSYRFTAEGLPAAPCTFIERGRLVRPVADLKYARRLGVEPTPVPNGPDTVHLEGPSELSLGHAIETAGEGLLVLSVLGVHTQDSASGDFSLSAPQALRIAAGRLGGRLRGTLSGNLWAVLRAPELCLVRFPGEHVPGLLFTCRFDPR